MRMRTVRRAVAGSLLVAALGAGCSDAEEALSGQTERAACKVAEQAMGKAQDVARSAVDEIGADPQSARRELTAVRDTVAAAQSGLSGEAEAKLAQAREALDTLVEEARESADGAVDEQEVEQARSKLDEAVAGLGDVC